MSRIVVIGGVAAGMSAASQAKRRDPGAEVIVLERGPYVSYGACGMPYNLLDPLRSMQDLIVIPAERFRSERGIDVRTGQEVQAIDHARRRLKVRDRSGRVEDVGYDALVVATGAYAVRPPLPGVELPGVFLLRELTDGEAMKRFLTESAPRRAVIVGAGYIGMEMAEALRGRGLDVVVLEKAPRILPGFAEPILDVVGKELSRAGVTVQTGISVHAIERASHGLTVITDQGRQPADLVLISVGVRPAVAVARAAGIALGETGAIAVTDRMETNLREVFAAGDCAEALHLVTGRSTWIPLGTTANKQGKVAGANAAGGDERFGGILGTAAFKVFDLEVGRTGLGPVETDRAGLAALLVPSTHPSRGHAYPGSKPVTTVLVVEATSGRLLGAQMVGGEAITGRIDVYATALTARMTVRDLGRLDLAYAPPLAPVYDPVLIAAGVAEKALNGSSRRRP